MHFDNIWLCICAISYIAFYSLCFSVAFMYVFTYAEFRSVVCILLSSVLYYHGNVFTVYFLKGKNFGGKCWIAQEKWKLKWFEIVYRDETQGFCSNTWTLTCLTSVICDPVVSCYWIRK